MAGIAYPEINNRTYSYASVEIDVDGDLFTAVKSINYSDSLDPGELRGTAVHRLQRTDGEYKAEASMELSLEEGYRLIKKLGNGFMLKAVKVTVQYAPDNMPVITDEIIGCRIKKADNSNQTGADPSMIKFDLDPMYIIRDGVAPIIFKNGQST
jgi:hypothetical protein